MKLVVGTRGSNLALVQTNWVVDQLKKENPGVGFEVKLIIYPSKSYSLVIESVNFPSSSSSKK